jgi:hypothetical protein
MAVTDRTQKDYDQSDVAHLLRKASPHSFEEMIRWLNRVGASDSRLTPSEVAKMTQDASKLQQRGQEFIEDPVQLYRAMKR